VKPAIAMSIRKLIPSRLALVVLGVVILIGAAFFTCLSAYLNWEDRQEWAEACAEADRLDPGWRWEDLGHAVPEIAPGHNSAERVAAAARLLEKGFAEAEARLDAELYRTPPQYRLGDAVIADIEAIIAASPARAEIERLADCPAGWIPLPDHPGRANFPNGRDSYTVTRGLLYPQLAVVADRGETDAALGLVRVIIYASRPPAELPSTYNNATAGDVRIGASMGVQRVLAQGEPSSAALESARRLLESETRRSLLLPGFRGERATIDVVIQGLNGRAPPWFAAKLADDGVFADPGLTQWDWADRRLARWTGGDLRRSNAAAILRHYTKLIEWLKRSPDGLKVHEAEWTALGANLAPGATHFVRWHPQYWSRIRDADAKLRCAAAALAAEQFRRETGHWPAALGELVPKYLSTVPRDPFDLKPLRLARRPDGIVISSVGEDGTDDGGAIASDGATKATDIGIRLWDVDKRRQPPLPNTAPPAKP
jgi:hypothetical protein